jgi:hypothetical protein
MQNPNVTLGKKNSCCLYENSLIGQTKERQKSDIILRNRQNPGNCRYYVSHIPSVSRNFLIILRATNSKRGLNFTREK